MPANPVQPAVDGDHQRRRRACNRAGSDLVPWRRRLLALRAAYGRLATRRFGASAGAGWRRALAYALTAPYFAQLATTPRARVRLVSATTALALAEGLGVRRRPTFAVAVEHRHGTSRFAVGGLSELEVLSEVFLHGTYELELATAPATVIDAGANIGASMHAFAIRHPAARLIGLEPAPGVLERLRENTRSLPRAELREVALAGHDGSVLLTVGRDSWASSTLATGTGGSSVEVRAVTLETLIDELAIDRVDLLKLDIEGSELAALAAVRRWDRIGTIVLEWHGDLHGQPVTMLRDLLPAHHHRASPISGEPQRSYVVAWPRGGEEPRTARID